MLGENLIERAWFWKASIKRMLSVFSVYIFFAALKEEIVALNKQYTEEWVEQDAEGVASFYTCNAKIMGAGMDVIHGKEGIQPTPPPPPKKKIIEFQ